MSLNVTAGSARPFTSCLSLTVRCSCAPTATFVHSAYSVSAFSGLFPRRLVSSRIPMEREKLGSSFVSTMKEAGRFSISIIKSDGACKSVSPFFWKTKVAMAVLTLRREGPKIGPVASTPLPPVPCPPAHDAPFCFACIKSLLLSSHPSPSSSSLFHAARPASPFFL